MILAGDIEAFTESVIESEVGAKSSASCYEHML